MSTSVNPDGTTNGVSGKLKAAVPAGGIATAVATTAVFELDKYVPAAHQIFSDAAWLPAVVVAGLAALVSFAAGYVAKHAPAGLVETARDEYVAVTAHPANLAAVPANAGRETASE